MDGQWGGVMAIHVSLQNFDLYFFSYNPHVISIMRAGKQAKMTRSQQKRLKKQRERDG